MRLRDRAAGVLAGLLLAAATTVGAQDDCAALAASALDALHVSCANLEANTACYGHPDVRATLTDPSYDILFARPGDRPPLNLLTSVHALPPDPAASTWGLARLRLAQGEMSETAAMLLLGDAVADNLSAPETPFRSLHFRGSPSTCNEAPSALAVQTPDDQPLDFVLNGAEVRIVSLVVFQWASSSTLAAIVYTGQFEVVGGQRATAGQTLLAVTDNQGRAAFWSAARASTVSERRTAEIAAAALTGRAVLPVVVVPPTATPEPPPATPVPPSCGSSVTHIVQPGDTVFRIAQRYGSTVSAITSANRLANPNQITVGQTLSIPCGVDSEPSSGQSIQSPDTPAASGSPTTLDCSALIGSLPPDAPPQMLDMLRQMCGG